MYLNIYFSGHKRISNLNHANLQTSDLRYAYVCMFHVFVLNQIHVFLINIGIDIEPNWLINPTVGGIYLSLLNPVI